MHAAGARYPQHVRPERAGPPKLGARINPETGQPYDAERLDDYLIVGHIEQLFLALERIQIFLEFDAKYCPNYDKVEQTGEPLVPDHSQTNSIRNSLYQLLLRQDSGLAADVYYRITIGMIFVSLLSLVLEEQFPLGGAWEIMEYIITIFFTLEYIVTLMIVNNPCVYAKQASSLADLFAVFPLYIEVIAQTNSSWILLIRLLRIARISRIRQTPNPYVNLIGEVFYKVQGLLLGILGYLSIGSLIIGTCVHVFEEDTFDTIPRGMWYGLVTLTTVGYGDFYPQETVGYFVGSLGIIIGLVLCSIVLMAVGQIYTDEIAILKDQFGEIEQCLIDNTPQYIEVKHGDDMHMANPDGLEVHEELFKAWLMACVKDDNCYPRIPELILEAKRNNGQLELEEQEDKYKDKKVDTEEEEENEPIKRQPETEMTDHTGGDVVKE